ncbi:hypothetical protein B9Z65_994 [Elsinoe australis]|uniref:RRM domain-containing protein n=1 Tax=Elsinoe australis TaxID=40998 RepID=A0A2P8AK74_9PEZI|nr:hypothetical protein B9Z65_994 [Elsinoe australis]
MDRALDDIISERPTSVEADREVAEEVEDLDDLRLAITKLVLEMASKREWVHDRYNDEDEGGRRPGRRDPYARYSPSPDRRRGAAPSEAKLRVENLHYELLEPEVRELFSRIGPVLTVQLLYDRHDRTTGTAFVTYHSVSDARAAVRDFDGANAYGQPIRVTFLPPSDARPSGGRNPFDNVEKPSRSLFERIDAGGEERSPDRRGRGRGRRSESPGRSRRDGEIDRYVPGSRGRERSPIRRRGTPRESGRRPGERTRGGRGGRRTDEAGRPVVGGRPKKTQEELDAEMNDYWGGDKGAQNGKAEDGAEQTAPAQGEGDVEIDLMVE